ncbi:deoxyhypusine hydroxylase [Brettanomyces nanus]|uniref:Deoxyhypusine hydroxylase n=1 Tax=Eeniella nana TaxID=13502 RepID=A0A875S3D4_EENNA|nr:deoxyhypusine hydroxylase [Brettanomyces nanus]QPG74572.1 deoxyhypusine hydroxylase [Brettanomyces nanus]
MAGADDFDELSSIERLRDILCNISGKDKLANRFRALFYLKSIGEEFGKDLERANKAVDYISECFHHSDSELLKHEVAYVLGQTKNMRAAPILRDVLRDMDQQVMVRHEAAEALGALGDKDSLEVLTKYLKDPKEVVPIQQTCELAIERIKWAHSDKPSKENLEKSLYSSIDPAPPMPIDANDADSIERLRDLLNNQDAPLFERYRAMFRLRDMDSDEACLALASSLNDPSALLKHEVAYVFGQIGNPIAVPHLTEVIDRNNEAPMVRHEAAEALGAIATDDVLPVLKRHLTDNVRVVKESAIVALDMYDYENSNQMEYAGVVE